MKTNKSEFFKEGDLLLHQDCFGASEGIAERYARCDLPAYRVYYEDGSSYVTSMAAGITLEAARKYFVGLWITQPDESSMRVIDVQNEPEDAASLIKDFDASNHGWCLSCGSMLAQYDDAGHCDNCSGAT